MVRMECVARAAREEPVEPKREGEVGYFEVWWRRAVRGREVGGMPVPVSVTVKVRRCGMRERVIVVAEASREFWRREVTAEGRVVWVSEVWRRESVLAG